MIQKKKKKGERDTQLEMEAPEFLKQDAWNL